MRFISKYARYNIDAIPERNELLADGTYRRVENGVMAAFGHTLPLHPWEVELGRDRFTFTGTTMEEDEVTPIDPIDRLSVYDTDFSAEQLGWSPELKKRVEDSLLAREGQDYVLAEAPVIPPPWPNYDKITTGHGRTLDAVARRIAERVEEDGYDAHKVMAYERDNANRPEVLEALTELVEKQRLDKSISGILVQA